MNKGQHITFSSLERAIEVCAAWGIPVYSIPYAHGTRLVILSHFDAVYSN